MTIITIATSKGGAGKTTAARLILGRAALSGLQTAGLDADLNHSLADWVTQLSKYPITVRQEIDQTQIVPAITELNEAHDLVVVDTAGAASQATIFAMGCADLIIVPAQLSSGDVMEAVKTMELARSVSNMMGKKIPAYVLITAYRPRTNISEHVERELAQAKLPVLGTKLQDLVAFKEMTFSGIVPTTGFAGHQVEALYSEIMELVTPKSLKAAG